jgi:hypothetical protein
MEEEIFHRLTVEEEIISHHSAHYGGRDISSAHYGGRDISSRRTNALDSPQIRVY